MAETQASQQGWTPPTGILAELVADARRRAEALTQGGRRTGGGRPRAGGLSAIVERLAGPTVAIIAEIKRRSPSKGVLNDTLLAGQRASEYVTGGAAVLSILTEPARFGGSIDDLKEVRRAVSVPLLRKDFIVHPAQLHEAREAGADLVLLIARALDVAHADELAREAMSIGLGVLFEVRDERELARAVAVPACMIGVNARNLETLAMEPEVSERLIPLVPADRVAVYESGVAGRADVESAARLGANAVLVGSLLSRQADGASAVAALTGVPRVSR